MARELSSEDTEDEMSTIERKRSGGLKTLDRALMVAGVVGGVLVVLWVFASLAHLVVDVFKVAILVIVIAVIVRLVHVMTRGRH
jgi:hypothetical protein